MAFYLQVASESGMEMQTENLNGKIFSYFQLYFTLKKNFFLYILNTFLIYYIINSFYICSRQA